MPSPFLALVHRAVAGAIAATLFVQQAAAQAHLYQVDSGGDAGACLGFHEATMSPIRVSGACAANVCGGSASRFQDLTSERGLLQVVSASSDGCTRLDGTAAWGGTHVVISGPPGEVTTRMRYRWSAAGSASVSGWPGYTVGGTLQSGWFAPTVPNNVTDFEIVTPYRTLGVGQAWVCNASIVSSVVAGSTCSLLHFPLNEPVFDLPPGYTANSPALGIVDNIWHGLDVEGDWNAATGDVACFSSMRLIHSVTGNLIVEDTPAGDIDLSGLVTVGGDMTVDDNDDADGIDLSGLVTFGGDMSVDDNDEADGIDLSGLVTAGGDVSVAGNGTSGSSLASSASLPMAVNLASLATVGGSLDISANSEDATVALGPLTLVDGDLTLETLVTGALDLSAAAIFGNIDIEARGADSVAVATPAIAGASTAIAITRGQSSIAADLPADTFALSEMVSVAHIDIGSWPYVRALDAAGGRIKLALLAAYALDVAGNPAWQQAATLALELNVAALPAKVQAAVLTGLTENRVVLAHRVGIAPYRALATCPLGTPPAIHGCAELALLDAAHNPLPPDSLELLAFVRFTALTDHSSEHAIAIEVGPEHIREMQGPPLPPATLMPQFTVFRNGSNVNLPVLVETSPALIGREWRAAIDLAGVDRTAFFLSVAGPAEGTFVQSGEVLLQPPVVVLSNPDLLLPIPRDSHLVGLTFSAQAAVHMESGWRLTNALDVTISGSQLAPVLR